MTTKYHNQSSVELRQRLEKLTATTVAAIKQMADILYELFIRGERHPFMREGVLRWYREIAMSKLTPLAALTFAGVGSIVRKIAELPHDMQNKIASGDQITVAEHDAKGEIIAADKPVLQLSTRQLDMVFDGGKIRSFEDQKKILAARQPDVRRSVVPINIRADLATGEIVCGQLRFKPIELNAALRALGFAPIKKMAKGKKKVA